MLFVKKIHILLVLSMLLLSSCAYQKEYSQVSRSGTLDEKYNFAVKAYDKQDYRKAVELFEELVPLYRGKDILERLLYNVAYSYFYEKDYFMSAYYFRSLTRQFPNSQYLEEASYMSAYCKTLESPDFRLDQTATVEAIKQLQLFINYYPNSRRSEEAGKLINDMREKLALKAYNVANMYYRRSLYNAASIAYSNFLKDYPESNVREQALYMMIKSRFLYAENSIKEKQSERYAKVIEGYEAFLRSFSDSKYRKEVDKYYKESKLKKI
ncbi:MAG: outer membrane protein assembly factor BamD [Bacteroidales bacterium]